MRFKSHPRSRNKLSILTTKTPPWKKNVHFDRSERYGAFWMQVWKNRLQVLVDSWVLVIVLQMCGRRGNLLNNRYLIHHLLTLVPHLFTDCKSTNLPSFQLTTISGGWERFALFIKASFYESKFWATTRPTAGGEEEETTGIFEEKVWKDLNFAGIRESYMRATCCVVFFCDRVGSTV
jgi:hypothetical protein